MAKEFRSARRPLLWVAVWTIAVMVGGYLLVCLFERIIHGILSDLATDAMDAQLGLDKIKCGGIFVVIGFYSVLRVTGYHPLGDSGYSTWLSTTPWRKGVRLPLGPLHLVWEDIVTVGVAAVGVFLAGNDWLIPVAIFAASYTMILIFAAPRWTPRVVEYFTGFAWPAVVLWWVYPWVASSLIVSILVVSQLGLWMVLAQFPWETKLDEEHQKEKGLRTANVWQLGPRPQMGRIPVVHGVVVPVMIGWWIYCLMVSFQPHWTWQGDNSPLAAVGTRHSVSRANSLAGIS